MMAPDGDMDKIDADVFVLGNGGLTQNGSEPNAMKTQSGAGIGSGSGSSGSWSFQFFVHNEDGLNLSVDLNSDPLDWMRACSNEIRVPQHIHRSKPMSMSSDEGSTRRLMVSGFSNSERTLQDGFYSRSLSEQIGISRIDESSARCIGKEVPTDLQVVPDAPKASAVQSVACEQGVVSEGTSLRQGVLNDSGQEPGDQQRVQAHENSVPGVDREPGDVVTIDQGISSGSGWESRDQQCVQAHEAMENDNGEISRNLQGDGPSENTLEEMNHTQTMIDFQDSQKHEVEVKKASNVMNLRTLKTLARGPIVSQEQDGDTKERRGRRKSARLTVKDDV